MSLGAPLVNVNTLPPPRPEAYRPIKTEKKKKKKKNTGAEKCAQEVFGKFYTAREREKAENHYVGDVTRGLCHDGYLLIASAARNFFPRAKNRRRNS